MVKTIKAYIDTYKLLEYIKSIDDFNNCKDFIVTDVKVNRDNAIEFKAIISDEIIDREESRYICR